MIRFLVIFAQICAVLAGLILTGITVMTCASVLGRDFFGKPIVGDFELVGVATGAAVALFLPWCQVKRGNIIVDFFTQKAPQSLNAGLDRLGALLMAVFMGVMAWRSSLGGMNAWVTKSESQMMGFPEWITYGFIVPPLVLVALIALTQAVAGFKSFENASTPT